MKPLLFVILSLLLVACTLRQPVSIFKMTEEFIDIEVRKEDFWLDCFELNQEEHLFLLAFYLKKDSELHEFFYRRLLSTKDCQSEKKDYMGMIQQVADVRIVGIHSSVDTKRQRIQGIPEKFATSYERLVHWTFIRLETKHKCKSYFENDCEPENYWGGIIPPR